MNAVDRTILLMRLRAFADYEPGTPLAALLRQAIEAITECEKAHK